MVKRKVCDMGKHEKRQNWCVHYDRRTSLEVRKGGSKKSSTGCYPQRSSTAVVT